MTLPQVSAPVPPAGPESRARKWLRAYDPPAAPVARVYAFPYSGGGAATFRRWQESTRTLEICAVALAGRERRIGEPPARRLSEVVEPVGTLIAERESAAGRPVVLLGVSMGALLAHQVALRLDDLGVPVRLLVTVGAPAPHLPLPSPVHQLPESDLVDWLLSLGGMDPAVLEYPELLGHLLPAIRADLELSNHRVRCDRTQMLDVPVLASFGTEDPLCTADEVARWDELTRRRTRVLPVPGGHFFSDTAVHHVMAELERELLLPCTHRG